MLSETEQLRVIINTMGCILGDVITAVARTGAFDKHEPEHLSDLLQKLDVALQTAQIRDAHYHILEAQAVLRNEEQAPRSR